MVAQERSDCDHAYEIEPEAIVHHDMQKGTGPRGLVYRRVCSDCGYVEAGVTWLNIEIALRTYEEGALP